MPAQDINCDLLTLPAAVAVKLALKQRRLRRPFRDAKPAVYPVAAALFSLVAQQQFSATIVPAINAHGKIVKTTLRCTPRSSAVGNGLVEQMLVESANDLMAQGKAKPGGIKLSVLAGQFVVEHKRYPFDAAARVVKKDLKQLKIPTNGRNLDQATQQAVDEWLSIFAAASPQVIYRIGIDIQRGFLGLDVNVNVDVAGRAGKRIITEMGTKAITELFKRGIQ